MFVCGCSDKCLVTKASYNGKEKKNVKNKRKKEEEE